jgi:hypothetical protein
MCGLGGVCVCGDPPSRLLLGAGGVPQGVDGVRGVPPIHLVIWGWVVRAVWAGGRARDNVVGGGEPTHTTKGWHTRHYHRTR